VGLSVCDVAIIGAGPYGLSIAAHLRKTRLKTRIFGKPMESWRDHMPEGMMLKSEPFASNLFDPDSSYTLKDYCRENNLPYQDIGTPMTLATFAAYGVAFQKRLVPHLEETNITSVQQTDGGFILQTATGEIFGAHRVILAVGITHFTHLPDFLQDLPHEYVTHTFNHSDLKKFSGRKIAVLGAGASAVDMAARLNVAGANVELIAKSPSIAFHEPSIEPRPLLERIKNPRSALGIGWKSKLSADLPLLFHMLPQKLRFRIVDRHLGPAPGWFCRDLVVGKFPQHMGCTIQNVSIENQKVHVKITEKDGTENTVVADHLIAGTGFRVSVSRLSFLDGSLRSKIKTIDDTPILTANFEASVPGLYFTGLAASNSFGPPSRFACGAEFASKRLLKHLSQPQPIKGYRPYTRPSPRLAQAGQIFSRARLLFTAITRGLALKRS